MDTIQKQQLEMFKSMQATFQKQFEGMRAESSKKAVSASTLPPYSGRNAWRYAEHMVLADDMLHTGEGLGNRPVSDFEF